MSADYEILDPRFRRLFNGSAKVDKLFTGCRWAEGPGLFCRRPLCRLVRHSEQPDAALR